MSKLRSQNPVQYNLKSNRLEAFSDGVFAIAITLLVLEISIPDLEGKSLLHALIKDWPTYFAYIVSFATIGAIWFAHNVLTDRLEHIDKNLMKLNLLLLLVVSFIPFPTKLLAGLINSEHEKVAATIYGLVVLSATLLLSALWRYSINNNLIKPDLGKITVQQLSDRLRPSQIGYLLLILVGLFIPTVAVAGYFFIALYILLPENIFIYLGNNK